MIPRVNDDSVFSIDFIRQPCTSTNSLSIPSITLDLIFKDDFSFYSDSVFADDLWISTSIMCLTIPCVKHESIFCYRFYASLVNSLTLSTPYVTCHSYFNCDFKVYSDSVFAHDFWSVGTLFAMTIPCVNDDSVFSIDFIRQPWISIRCRFHPSPLT